jgi:type I restriction enzyme S subunit
MHVAGRNIGAAVRVSKRVRLLANDLVFSRLHTQNGAFAFADREYHATGTFVPLEIDETAADRRYLYWALHKAVPSLSASDTVGRETFKTQEILALEFALPPLANQRRIAQKLDTLAAMLNDAQSLRRECGIETEALFAKSIDAVFATIGSNLIAIGDVFRVTTGGTPSRQNPAYWDGDINWVASGEVAFCRIRSTAERITKAGSLNSNAKVYPPSTVLLAMIGQGKTRGQCAILDCYAATNQNVAGIHVYETEHSPEFLYWWLLSTYQKSRSAETGTAQPALSAERVKQLKMPLPGREDQNRAVSELSRIQQSFDDLRHVQQDTVPELRVLLPSIVDAAFRDVWK